MKTTDAVQYLPSRKLDPLMVVSCASPYCDHKVQLAYAKAHPALAKDGTVKMFFFCGEACITTVITDGRC